jgi:hypothetical protein
MEVHLLFLQITELHRSENSTGTSMVAAHSLLGRLPRLQVRQARHTASEQDTCGPHPHGGALISMALPSQLSRLTLLWTHVN